MTHYIIIYKNLKFYFLLIHFYFSPQHKNIIEKILNIYYQDFYMITQSKTVLCKFSLE